MAHASSRSPSRPNGPKAFDDVVVRYDPPVARSGPDRVAAEYTQVNWHVETGGRFGYEDFINPDFIGAKSFSLLQRLQQARLSAPPNSHFTFLTTYRIRDDDPLDEGASKREHRNEPVRARLQYEANDLDARCGAAHCHDTGVKSAVRLRPA